MALDRWFPTRFTMLSRPSGDPERHPDDGWVGDGCWCVATGGSVKFLVVLYSITVFITFVLSQLGMVRHWWQVRRENKAWVRKISVNGIGLVIDDLFWSR